MKVYKSKNRDNTLPKKLVDYDELCRLLSDIRDDIIYHGNSDMLQRFSKLLDENDLNIFSESD
jgi:hypothetical protein